MSKFLEGTKVILKTFNGVLTSPKGTDPSEDYWSLIGQPGIIIKSPDEEGLYASFSEKKRLLVKFEIDVKKLGLECHNEIQNTLWILESDLALDEDRSQ